MRDEMDSIWGQRLERLRHEIDDQLVDVMDDPLFQQLLVESGAASGLLGRLLGDEFTAHRGAPR